MKTWIVKRADGSTTEHCTNGDSLSAEGIDAGIARAETPRASRPTEYWDWAAKVWVEEPARVEALLLARIDQERAARSSAAMTAGRSVTLAYARKGAEAITFTEMSTAAQDALTGEEQAARFPWLSALADAADTTLADAATDVLAGMAASEAAIRTIDAQAVAAKAAVRVADSAADKRAAAEPFLGDRS